MIGIHRNEFPQRNKSAMKVILQLSGCLLILFWTGALALQAETEGSRRSISAQSKLTLNRSPSSYQVVDEKLEYDSEKSRIAMRIIVSEKHSKESLTRLLQQLSASIHARIAFQTGAPLHHLVIWSYISKTHVHSKALWLANLQQEGDSEPAIHFNELQLQELRSPPEPRFGLSEEERKEVWQELKRLQAVATEQAAAQYPLDPSNFKEVEQRFHLSKKTTLILAEPETPDPLADMKGAVSLIPKTVITLLHSLDQHGRLWHYVEALSPIEEPTQTGWIDSLALANQVQLPDATYRDNVQALADELDFEYKFQLAGKYRLSFRALDQILIEGVFKKWPL